MPRFARASSLDLSDIKNAADVRMRHLARQSNFARETLQSLLRLRQRPWQKFQCHRLAQFQILRAIDFAHTAFAKRRNNAIPIGEGSSGNIACFVARGRGNPATRREIPLARRSARPAPWRTGAARSGFRLERRPRAANHRAAARRAKARCIRDFTSASRAAHGFCGSVSYSLLPSSGSAEG